MEFNKIQKLNEELDYTVIKGKKYITVNKRVLAFRQLFPNGRITTEIVKLSNDNGTTVIVKANVYDGENLISTGHAFENPSKNTNINKFSAIENCETSAVGRALGFLGIGSTDSIASLEEIEPEATALEATPVLVTEAHRTMLEKIYKGENLQRLLDHYQIEDLGQLEDRIATGLIAQIAAKQKAKKGA